VLIKSTILYAPSVILPRLSSFVLLIYLTHRLPIGEFGLYALVVAIGETVDMGFSGWIRFSLLRLDIAQPRSWRKALATSYAMYAASTALAVAASIPIGFAIAPERGLEFSLALCAYVAATALQRIGLTSLQMREKLVVFSSVETARAALQLIFVWLALVHIGRSFCIASIGASMATLACGAAAVIFSRLALPPGDEEPATGRKQRLIYGATLIALSLLAYLALSLDRILLKLLSGAAAVGIYSAAYTLGRQPIDVLSNSVNQGALPELIKRYDLNGKTDAGSFVAGMLNFTNLLLFGAFGMLLGISGPLIDTFLPRAYHRDAVLILPLVALAFIVQNLKTAIYDNIFNLYKNNTMQIVSYIPVIFILVVASFILVPQLGATGEAIALALSMIAGLAASFFLVRRYMTVRIDLGEPAKAVALAVAAGIASAAAARFAGPLAAAMQLCLGAIAGGAAWLLLAALLRPVSLESVRTRLTEWLNRSQSP
jgi:O-antigen/teichoic acid export membrane protein